MDGYMYDQGRSMNAIYAEQSGRLPLPKARAIVAETLGCPENVAQAALWLLWTGEWHHVGRYANKIPYFDTRDRRLRGVVNHILAVGGADKFSKRLEAVRAYRAKWRPFRAHGPCPGRYAEWAESRREQRKVAAEALGRQPVGPHHVHFRILLLTSEYGWPAKVHAARRAGWTDDAIALAMAECFCSAEEIARALRQPDSSKADQ